MFKKHLYKMRKIIVTGGYGFIGSAVIRNLLLNQKNIILNIDNLTYSSILQSLSKCKNNKNYYFIKENICNYKSIEKIINKFKPNLILNLAAETHVDNSINNSKKFINTNIFGTYNLLEISRLYYLKKKKNFKFKFYQISTDEVYGDLGISNKKFNENSKYIPSSPYSASKASADHLVKAWARTYNLPFIITNSSNNYGPYQHTEKLIPLVIKNCFMQIKIPIYGNGKQKRDWIFVEDHAKAIAKIALSNITNKTYCIGANQNISNLEIVKLICDMMDKKYPKRLIKIKSHNQLISFVKDRPGHDINYSINAKKFMTDLKWKPKITLKKGLLNTINYYASRYINIMQ